MTLKHHILKGSIKIFSPVLIGSGKDEKTDIDLILDGQGQPFIPATSLAGVLRHLCNKYFNSDEIEKLWGFTRGNDARQSLLLFSDLPGKNLKLGKRTGVKISNVTGTAEDTALYEYQIIESGDFDLRIEARSLDNNQAELIERAFNLFHYLFTKKINIGAKTTSGLGLIGLDNGNNLKYYCLDLSKINHLVLWLEGQPEKGDPISLNSPVDESPTKYLELNLSLILKSSLIIRDYSADPAEPDCISLSSANSYVISGTSLKGALRARAEKILNTLGDETKTYALLNDLFGCMDAAKSKNSVTGVARKGKFIVKEVKTSLQAEQQTRIKIDRFTGGTIKGALLEEMPLFSNGSDASSEINIQIKILDYEDWQVGLLLLLFKDLWTGDLPVGGEKSIGRGVFAGKSAQLKLSSEKEEEKKFIQYQFTADNNSIKVTKSEINFSGQTGNDVFHELDYYIKSLHDKLNNETGGSNNES